jgi:hypothetical protein
MVGIDDAAAGDAAGARQPELTPISFASATNISRSAAARRSSQRVGGRNTA